MTSDANSGRAGLWTKPKFPGDAVRYLMVKRGNGPTYETGRIAIEQHQSVIRVASYLPGFTDAIPERQQHYRFDNQADAMFDNYVQDAYAAGWQNAPEFVMCEGKREYAPWGVHTCHDGVDHPINGCGFCDRCGENVEELAADG